MKMTKLKIVVIITISFILTIIFTKYIFLQNSTDVQPKFIVNISRILTNLTNSPHNYYLALKNFFSPKPKPNIPDQQITPSITSSVNPNLTSPTIINITNVPNPTIQPTTPITIPTINLNTLSYIPFTQGISISIDNASNNKFLKIEAGTVVEVQEYELIDNRRIKVITPIY